MPDFDFASLLEGSDILGSDGLASQEREDFLPFLPSIPSVQGLPNHLQPQGQNSGVPGQAGEPGAGDVVPQARFEALEYIGVGSRREESGAPPSLQDRPHIQSLPGKA